MNLEQLLEATVFGTRVRLVYSNLSYHIGDEFITEFIMSQELEYKKEYEVIEPHLEKEVIAIGITLDGKLCVEIY